MAFTVTKDDVEDLWRPLEDHEVDRITHQLEQAVAILQLRVPNLDQRTADNQYLDRAARGIVVGMVKRASASGDAGQPGVSQHLQVAGSFTDQRIFKNPLGDLYVLDNELALLLPQPTRRTARTISTPPLR